MPCKLQVDLPHGFSGQHTTSVRTHIHTQTTRSHSQTIRPLQWPDIAHMLEQCGSGGQILQCGFRATHCNHQVWPCTPDKQLVCPGAIKQDQRTRTNVWFGCLAWLLVRAVLSVSSSSSFAEQGHSSLELLTESRKFGSRGFGRQQSQSRLGSGTKWETTVHQQVSREAGGTTCS